MDEFEKKCRVEKNDILGRHLVATMDLTAGETVLMDRPTLILPQSGERRCANCLKLAKEFCSACKVFALCDDCKTHNSYDCDFFANIAKKQQSAGLQENQVNLIELQRKHDDICALIKCLLLRENEDNRKHFDRLLALESHCEERRNSEVWQELKERIVEPLFKTNFPTVLKQEPESVNDDFLQRILGIIDVNSFEIRAADEASLRAIFLRASLLSHDCVANLTVAVNDHYQMKVYANRDIAKDEILTHCYTNVMLGTEERRESLRIGKYFNCTCIRCEDPTELESHLSTLLCIPCSHRDEDGFVVKTKDGDGKWQCLRCGHVMPTKNVAAILERAKEETFHAKDDIYRYELLLSKLTQFLHKNHYLMLDLKQNVAAILRSIIGNPARRPGQKVYQRKVRLCQEILMALYHIQPGEISRLRAITLYELCSAQAEFNRLRYHEKEITKEELKEQLGQSEAMLHESLRMMLHEPPDTPEGRLAKSMLKELKDLQNDIKVLTEENI